MQTNERKVVIPGFGASLPKCVGDLIIDDDATYMVHEEAPHIRLYINPRVPQKRHAH